MKKRYIFSLSIITLLFSACGGGGGSDASFSNAEQKIDINETCITTPTSSDISNYITLESGDTIIKDADNTVISTYHDVNGTKKVCLVSGSAYILRK